MNWFDLHNLDINAVEQTKLSNEPGHHLWFFFVIDLSHHLIMKYDFLQMILRTFHGQNPIKIPQNTHFSSMYRKKHF